MRFQTLARLTWYSLMITSLGVFILAVPARYSQMMSDPCTSIPLMEKS